MTEFKPEEFLQSLDQEKFDNLKKENLILLAEHLSVSVKRSMKKREIQYKVAAELVESKVFKESILKDYICEPTEIECKMMELELKIMKLKLKERT